MTGFEPATSGSTIRRSNQLSYTHHPGCAESGDLNKVENAAATGGVIIGHGSFVNGGE